MVSRGGKVIRFSRSHVIRKRPRLFVHLYPKKIRCGENGWYCPECLQNLSEEAEYRRPGHLWMVEDCNRETLRTQT